MSNFEIINRLLADGKADEAMEKLKVVLADDRDNDQAWYLMGKAQWRRGDRSGAMSSYSKAIAVNPDSPARVALDQAREIAAFFNPDLLNP